MGEVKSEHLFIFPFSWKYSRGRGDALFKQHNQIKGKRFSYLTNWQAHLSHIESSQDYNEYVYFYKPIRMALYTFEGKPVIVRNYIYKKLDSTGKLKITIEDEIYELDVKGIDLKLYKTGIGLLCFDILNKKYSQREEINRINTFSCCVYPPMMPLEKAQLRGFPSKIELRVNENENIKEDFIANYYDETLPISSLIMSILGKPFTSKIALTNDERILIEPILGYQMFCCCIYYNKSLCEKMKQEEQIEEQMAKWMNLSYAEIGKDRINDGEEESKPCFILKGNPVYSVNRRMLFGLSEAYPCEKLYDQLVKLVLMQRATLLNLSTEIARISTLPKSEISPAISSVYEIYIQFINQLYFKEVTEEGEGSLIYDQLSKVFKIQEELEQLSFEVNEVHEYATLVEQSSSNVKVQLLTIIGAALVLPSFATGFFGMNIFQEEAPHWWHYKAVALWLNSYVCLPILLVVALCIWTKRKTLSSLIIKVLLTLLLLISFSFTIKYGCGI